MQKYEYTSIGETLYCDTLSNGLKISVLTKPGYTRCYAFFATNYGGADRCFRLGDEYITTPMGVAHFLEHKMFDMPDEDNALAILAANGAQPNAYTSSGITAYHFESTANFNENLRTLLRFVSTPYFTDESVAKEQGIIGQEIRMCEDSPDYVIYDELTRCLYDHHPVRDSVVGTIESIAEITPQTLYNCHKIFYTPGNMALTVVGDVDPEQVRAIALEILPSDCGEIPCREYGPPETLLPAKTRFLRSMEVSAPQFIIGAKVGHAEGNALLRQKIVSGIALNYLYSQSSPFYSRLYSEGLLNSDFCVEADFSAGTATLLAAGESKNPEAVFEQFCAEAETVAREGLEPKYFMRTLRASYGARIRALSSFAGLCAGMASASFGGYNFLDVFSVTETITAEEVRGFIREYLCRDHLAMSVIVPTSGKESIEDYA